MADESDWATARAKAIVEEELRLHGFPDGTDDLRRIVRDALIGSPGRSGTGLHGLRPPTAYWRGDKDGVQGAVRVLRYALETGDHGGTCGDPELDQLRKDICKLGREHAAMLALLQSTYGVPCIIPDDEAPYEDKCLVSRGSWLHERAKRLFYEIEHGHRPVRLLTDEETADKER